MTLLRRIARDKSEGANIVRGHRVENALKLYFHGKITRTQMINFFNIPSNMEADFDKFKTRYDSFNTNNVGFENRQNYVQDVEASIIALQNGDITRAQFNTFTGLDLDET